MPQHGELKKLQGLFNSVYLLKDQYVLKMLIASVISQRLPCDPVWIIIVAPSGGGKTEILNSIASCAGVCPLSTLTAQTFISGAKSSTHETSLLNKIGNGIITFKDMTSLLSEHYEERAVIMAQLREIYDGKYTKSFGTGQTIAWQGKITIIAGSTYAIHTLKASYSAMGERFIMYNMIQPDRIEAAKRAMENQEGGKMSESRKMLADATKEYIEVKLEMPSEHPKITEDFRSELLLLAELATRARSDVERNWRSPQQEITEVHPPEMPTRFASSLQGFSRALMILNWNETGVMELLPEDKTILNKLALDSITKSRRRAMQELAKYDVIETSGLAVKLSLPTNSVRRWLEDLTVLEIVERVKGSGPKGDKWNILPKYKDIIQKFEGIKNEGKELTEYVGNPSPEEEYLEEVV